MGVPIGDILTELLVEQAEHTRALVAEIVEADGIVQFAFVLGHVRHRANDLALAYHMWVMSVV